MKHIAISLVALMTLTAFAAAEENNSLSEKEKKEGWQLLFDGKTAKGWNSWKTKSPLELNQWKAEDGALTLSARGAGDIYTTETFENYELVLEWKTTGNSGILIRVNPEVKGPIYKVAPEMQIERTGGKSSTSAGGLYALYEIECEGDKVIHPDGWNSVKIRMVDGHGTHWFNGKKDQRLPNWFGRVESSRRQEQV